MRLKIRDDFKAQKLFMVSFRLVIKIGQENEALGKQQATGIVFIQMFSTMLNVLFIDLWTAVLVDILFFLY